jgi:protein phosphatase
MAQDLVDQGALPPERLASSPFTHVLTSAIGSDEATPEVTRLQINQRNGVILLCSDGLTKHVSDREITEELQALQSSEQVCRALLDRALAGGGSDNITVVIGRVRPRGE